MNRFKSCAMLLISIFATSISFAACSDDDEPEKDPELCDPSSTAVDIKAEKSEEDVTVTIKNAKKNIALQTTSAEKWCTISANLEEENKDESVYSVKIKAEANNEAEARTCQITLSYDSQSKTIIVKQVGLTIEYEPNIKNVDLSVMKGQEWDTTDATTIAFSIGMGWNLGNQFDAHDRGVAKETAWGNPKATQELFTSLKANGINTVRIPVTWLGQFGGAPDYKINEEWLDRIYEVVGYAEKAGQKAIINIHHDGAADNVDKGPNYWLNIVKATNDPAENETIKAILTALWTQISEKFKDKGDFLIFECMNEIHDGGWGWGNNRTDGGKQYATMNEWLQTVVDAVRATGGNNATRWIGIPGYDTNADITIESLVLPNDPANKLLVAVHNYDPYEYTLTNKYTQWGHTAVSSKKCTNGKEADIKSVLNKLKTNYVDKGIPVYLGEMGCVRRDNALDEVFRRYYLEYFCRAAREYGIAPIIWDNGAKGTGNENSGMFDRSTGKFLNDDSEQAVRHFTAGYWPSLSELSLSTVYDNAPSAKK